MKMDYTFKILMFIVLIMLKRALEHYSKINPMRLDKKESRYF